MLWLALQAAGHEVFNHATNVDKVVCWGSIGEGLNGSPAITGVAQLEKLSNHEGVLVPEFTTDPEEAASWVQKGLMVFGRRNNHTQGRDIVGPTQQAFYDRDYWVKMIPNISEEWRIHVFDGHSIARGKKVYDDSSGVPPCIRSRRRGWRMRHDVDPSRGLRPAAKAAVEALGYDFGAVDLVLTREGQMYVLEVNKQPGLDDYTAQKYAVAIGSTTGR